MARLYVCMCGRSVGIFNQAIFRSPLVDSDVKTAEEEVARAERTIQGQSTLALVGKSGLKKHKRLFCGTERK